MTSVLKGVVHGRTIEFDRELQLPDGQEVTVTLHSAERPRNSVAGDGLRRAFGSWAEDSDQLDDFLAGVRRDRQDSRPVPSE